MKLPGHLYIVKEEKKPTKMEGRKRSIKEYHTARWTKESAAFKQSHPVCERCRKKGIIRASEVTDHVIPVEIYHDFWDHSNWQGLCKTCNIEKGNEDKKLINKYRDEKRKNHN